MTRFGDGKERTIGGDFTLRQKIIDKIAAQNDSLRLGFDLEDMAAPIADEIMDLFTPGPDGIYRERTDA